ncbi:hypothetical protein [Streptomyces yunnanensis]|uniref:Uncharacterized protein n=1 Tax=Streptomyces yunnanensis TaxID=156453 RepID=A0A9X8QS94_9ACTN|nr:hypothetical protein [Streptomyces yunnanensis]SHL74267.1 hypothetical protein SAMN05216268_10644 [Streptomyces yunnanensis]
MITAAEHVDQVALTAVVGLFALIGLVELFNILLEKLGRTGTLCRKVRETWTERGRPTRNAELVVVDAERSKTRKARVKM